MRIRSTTRGSSSRLLLRLLHGSILLPCRISGKMTIPLDTFTTIAMLSCLDAIVTCRASHLLCQPSPCCHETSNLDTFLAKPLFGYVTRLLSLACSVLLIALLVAGEDEVRSRRELVVGISQYL